MLLNTNEKIEAISMWKVVHTYNQLIFTYCAQAGRQLQTRENYKRKTLQDDFDKNCKRLDNAQNSAQFAILQL